MDCVKTFRIPRELGERMEIARGDQSESDWFREVVADYLANREQYDLEDMRELMARRGITLERLTEYINAKQS